MRLFSAWKQRLHINPVKLYGYALLATQSTQHIVYYDAQ